jgi:hypothetical protein
MAEPRKFDVPGLVAAPVVSVPVPDSSFLNSRVADFVRDIFDDYENARFPAFHLLTLVGNLRDLG